MARRCSVVQLLLARVHDSRSALATSRRGRSAVIRRDPCYRSSTVRLPASRSRSGQRDRGLPVDCDSCPAPQRMKPGSATRPTQASRMGRDSNSREACTSTRFPGVRLKPLGHPSLHRRRQAAHIPRSCSLVHDPGAHAPRNPGAHAPRNPGARWSPRCPQKKKVRARALTFSSPDGRGEIRTHDTVAGMPVFETGAFNHSATRPGASKFTRTPLACQRVHRHRAARERTR